MGQNQQDRSGPAGKIPQLSDEQPELMLFCDCLWLMEGSNRVDGVKYFTVACLHTSTERLEMLDEAKENSS